MKTTYKTSPIQNVSDYERGFRLILALSMMTAVVGGAIVSPVAIAALSKFAIYLAMTAIIAIDPVYRLAQWATKHLTNSDHGAGRDYA